MTIGYLNHEVDGASGNDKLHFFIAEPKEKTEFISKVWCGNHAEHLITGSVLLLLSIRLLNDLFSASNFLRDNGHWLRLFKAVDILASWDRIQIVAGKHKKNQQRMFQNHNLRAHKVIPQKSARRSSSTPKSGCCGSGTSRSASPMSKSMRIRRSLFHRVCKWTSRSSVTSSMASGGSRGN